MILVQLHRLDSFSNLISLNKLLEPIRPTLNFENVRRLPSDGRLHSLQFAEMQGCQAGVGRIQVLFALMRATQRASILPASVRDEDVRRAGLGIPGVHHIRRLHEVVVVTETEQGEVDPLSGARLELQRTGRGEGHGGGLRQRRCHRSRARVPRRGGDGDVNRGSGVVYLDRVVAPQMTCLEHCSK